MKTAKEILVGAKQAILERGWGQGHYVGQSGCVCMYGAIYIAAGAVGIDDEFNIASLDGAARDALSVAERALQAVCPNSPIAFNDTPGRTVDEVLVKIDAAIGAVAA